MPSEDPGAGELDVVCGPDSSESETLSSWAFAHLIVYMMDYDDVHAAFSVNRVLWHNALKAIGLLHVLRGVVPCIPDCGAAAYHCAQGAVPATATVAVLEGRMTQSPQHTKQAVAQAVRKQGLAMSVAGGQNRGEWRAQGVLGVSGRSWAGTWFPARSQLLLWQTSIVIQWRHVAWFCEVQAPPTLTSP